MTYPLLADSLNLDSWSLGGFKTTTKSKQRSTPVLASGKPATFKLSSEPLVCPWGVGKFQDVDSGRITLDLKLKDETRIEALENRRLGSESRQCFEVKGHVQTNHN